MISSLLLFAAGAFVFGVLGLSCASAGAATPVNIVVAKSKGVQAPLESFDFDFDLRSLMGTPPWSGICHSSNTDVMGLAVAPLPHWTGHYDYSVTVGPSASRNGPSQRS